MVTNTSYEDKGRMGQKFMEFFNSVLLNSESVNSLRNELREVLKAPLK